jgi:hypothetical protein
MRSRGPSRSQRKEVSSRTSGGARLDSRSTPADNAPRPGPGVIVIEREDPNGQRWHQALERLLEAGMADARATERDDH